MAYSSRFRASTLRKEIALTMCAALLSLSLAGTKPVGAEPLVSTVKPYVADDLAWAGSDLSVFSDGITLAPASHFQGIAGTINLSAFSTNPGIVSPAVDSANLLQLTVAGTGEAEIRLTAQSTDSPVLTETFKVKVTKIGDTTGDGIITPADALYIMKVVNGKIPLSDADSIRLDINGDGQVTAADSTLLLGSYVGNKSPSTGPRYVVELSDSNDAPVRYDLQITGTVQTGETVTASSQYTDVEGDAEANAVYQWYRGYQADGSDRTPISGAAQSTYTVSDADQGYYLFVDVVSTDARGAASANAVLSAASVKVPDTTAPTLAGTVPAAGGEKTDIAEPLKLTFSEPVAAVGGNKITVRKASDDSLVLDLDADDPSVTVAGNQAVIQHSPFDENTAYYAEVEPGAFEDEGGNGFAGITGTSAWRFTTNDTTAPLAVSFSPTDDATGVPLNGDLTLVFNEDVSAAAGKTIAITDAFGTALATLQADDDQHVIVAGSTVTIKHDAPFASDTGYYVQIEPGAFRDSHLNGYAGIQDQSGWSFVSADNRTLVASTYTALTESEIRNDDGLVVLTVTEDKFNDTVTLADFELLNAPPGVTVQDAEYGDDSTVYVFLDSDGTDYDVDYPNLTVKAAGTALASGKPLSANAVGITADIEPVVSVMTPAAGESGFSKTGNLVLGFDRAVTAADEGSIHIYRQSDDSEAAVIAADDPTNVTISGSTVTIKHDALESLAAYYVLIDAGAFADNAGLPYAGIADQSAWTFTTSDIIPLTISTMTPETGSGTLKRWSDLVLTFDRSVTAATGKKISIYAKAGDALIDSIDADDLTKIGIAGNTVTIKHADLAASTDYYVLIDEGAFRDADGVAYAGIAGKDGWAFTTRAANPNSPFISEYAQGDPYEAAIQVYWTIAGGPTAGQGYELSVYKAGAATLTMPVWDFLQYPVQIIIDDAFYDFMDLAPQDVPNLGGVNDPGLPVRIYEAGHPVTAIVLKKNGVIVDALGDPNSSAALLPAGGTMIRKPGMKGGSAAYDAVEWQFDPQLNLSTMHHHIE